MHVERPTILCFWLLLNSTLFASVALAQIPGDSRLYNGREYIRNGTPAKGTPYFAYDSLHAGSLTYEGIAYQLQLEYDLAQDQLVIRYYNDDILISLVGEKTDWFSIGPYRFRYVGSNTALLPEAGFYEELLTGSKATLLARKHKDLVFPTSADQQAKYVEFDTYFLLMDGISHKISNERDLFSILKENKDDLRKYIRKNNLSFRRHLEESLIQTIAYYQQLKS